MGYPGLDVDFLQFGRIQLARTVTFLQLAIRLGSMKDDGGTKQACPEPKETTRLSD